jgi:hypothetical protein
LVACRSIAVAGPLAADLNGYAAGRLHDEIAWRDVALHACRVLQTNEKVIFVTAWQMAEGAAQIRYATDDGYRVVVVPDDIARSLNGLTDLNGRPLVDMGRYRDEWNSSFSFTFVQPETMTAAERAVYTRIGEIAALAKIDLAKRKLSVLISETMRLSQSGDLVLGVWEPVDRRIVVRRDQLHDLTRFAGTLLHEIGHMASGTADGTLEFENELSRLLGITASAALSP